MYLKAADLNPEKCPPKTGCFVATACYGDYGHPVVVELRHFRDDWLETSPIGRAFVRWYYRWSPPFANFISPNPILKTLARVLIVAPAVAVARITKKQLLTGKPAPKQGKELLDSKPKSDSKKELLTSKPDKKAGQQLLNG